MGDQRLADLLRELRSQPSSSGGRAVAWMRHRWDELEELRRQATPPTWTEVAAFMRADGVTYADGRRADAELARKTHDKIRRSKERVAARAASRGTRPAVEPAPAPAAAPVVPVSKPKLKDPTDIFRPAGGNRDDEP